MWRARGFLYDIDKVEQTRKAKRDMTQHYFPP